MKYLFIRDDDVKVFTPQFIEIFYLFKKYKIPVIYAVIPKGVDEKTVSFLNKEKQKNPGLLDIIQHGFQHTNYAPAGIPKYEFGDRRTYAQQKADILRGLKKMQRLFGKNFTPAFTPPYHKYNLTTLKIINELKIPVFSANKPTRWKKKKFHDIPINIELNDYQNGLVNISAVEMIKRISKKLNSPQRIIGLLFHHKTFTHENHFKEMEKVLKFLMKNKGVISFMLFSTIVRLTHIKKKMNYKSILIRKK